MPLIIKYILLPIHYTKTIYNFHPWWSFFRIHTKNVRFFWIKLIFHYLLLLILLCIQLSFFRFGLKNKKIILPSSVNASHGSSSFSSLFSSCSVSSSFILGSILAGPILVISRSKYLNLETYIHSNPFKVNLISIPFSKIKLINSGWSSFPSISQLTFGIMK